MLRLIEGGSGSGKSFWMKETIRTLAEKGEKVLLIVPEQFSFETEREYYGALGHRLMEQVEVLSFVKLSEMIFRQYGGLAGEYASDTAKRVIMRLAVKACRDNLSVYGKSGGNPELNRQLVSLRDEFANSGIDAAALAQAACRETGSLKEKLSDLSLLFESYQALLHQRYLDPVDRLSVALELVRGKGYFAGKTVFLDEFKSFTALQNEFLRQMLRECSDLYVSLCVESDEAGKQLFAGVMETHRRLRGLAARENVKTAPPLRFLENRRFASKALSHFVKGLFRYQNEPFTGENDGVFCGAFYNEFDEAEYAAAKICHLVMEENWRFSDIAVLVRDMAQYGPILEAAFDKYGVPYFKDGAESIDTMPMVRFVLRLFQLLSGKVKREELLALLKCGIFDFSEQEIYDFESYTYVWQIEGDSFGEAFTKNPNGFTNRPMSDKDLSLLENAEKLRQFLWEFILQLRCRVTEQNSIGKGVFAHLAETGIIQRQQQRIAALNDSGDFSGAQDEKRSWDSIMEIFDTLESLLSLQKDGSAPLSSGEIREYRELFAFSAAGYTLAERPQTVDSVLLGSAERVRVKEKKAVLLLGLNDGSFPLLPSDGGLLSSKERTSLIENGIELSSTFEQRLTDERYVTYLAAAVPSHRLILSYALGDLTGNEKQPSALIDDFTGMFPQSGILQQKNIPPEFYCLSVTTTLLQYAKSRGREDAGTFLQSAGSVLARHPLAVKRLDKLKEKGEKARYGLTDAALSEKLFTAEGEKRSFALSPLTGGKYRIVQKEYRKRKRELILSPSQIERYYSCSFQYFCRYGLGLQSKRKAELDPLSRGNVIHEFLRYALLREEKNLSAARLAEDFLEYYLQKFMGGVHGKSSKFLYFYRRLQDTLTRLLTALRQELAQSEFQVSGVEESIRKGGVIAPFTAKTADGRQISVIGKIDRADRFVNPQDEKEYVRIVDYKSGGRQFDISAMAAGLNLQMLLYLFAIARSKTGKYKNARPAGILYMPAGNVKPTLGRDSDQEQTADALTNGYKMNGMLLEDGRVLTAMEKNLEGKYIPISLGAKGYKGKYLCSPAEFLLLEQKAERLVSNMAEALLSGRIYPSPKKQQGSLYTPCDYCEFKSLCGHEAEDGAVLVEKIDYEDLISQLKGESDDA